VHHFLVLRFDDRVAQGQRGAGDAENHADDHHQQTGGDHHLDQGEAAVSGAWRMRSHG
jgi:hypothetical protein